MLLVWFIPLCFSITAGKVIDGGITSLNRDEIIWPDKYTVRATKLSLTTSRVETCVIWRTEKKSRKDLSDGNVKIFGFLSRKKVRKYEVHTVTDKNENIRHKCTYLNAEDPKDDMILDEILPDIENIDFEAIGYENVIGIEAQRFESTEEYKKKGIVETFWAIYDGDLNYWQPIRYDKKNYDTELGSLTDHEIWEFWDFGIDFDEKKTFSLKSFRCHSRREDARDTDAENLTFISANKDNHEDHVFNSFKERFNRKYAHEEEHNIRKTIFKQNLRLITSVNSQNLGYKLAINQFADRTPEEMKKRAGLKKQSKGKTGSIPFPYAGRKLKSFVDELPTAVDLRIDGLVSPVLDQGECGSCWSFGATSAAEGAIARSNGGTLKRLSNQALVDCAWGFGTKGCHGGYDQDAYKWMIKYGLPTEEDYGPYSNLDGMCHIANMTKYPIKGYTFVPPLNYGALKVALINHGPLYVGMQTTDEFSFYSSGIFYDIHCNGTEADHAVTLVGYGEKYGERFWILKNSYGVNWGMEGYMLISAKDNNCGIASGASYVVA